MAEPGVNPDLSTDASPDEPIETTAPKGSFGGITPQEAGRLSGIARREARERRETESQLSKLTLRQRLGLSLSKLSQDQLDGVVSRLATDAAHGDARAVHALARLTDQAFGRATPEEEDAPESTRTALEGMSRAERAVVMARALEELRADHEPSKDASDPRGDAVDPE